ncbi:MAG TPA: hypothetical protein VJ672_07820 [Gemmatimonadaceae bacterium]|nr:hypothetical protein [Gemmatimonadaceae bacterium]
MIRLVHDGRPRRSIHRNGLTLIRPGDGGHERRIRQAFQRLARRRRLLAARALDACDPLEHWRLRQHGASEEPSIGRVMHARSRMAGT